MIYRVKFDCGYKEFYFDFPDANNAAKFMTSAAASYNKKQSDHIEITLVTLTREEYKALNKEEEKKQDD